MRFIRSLDWILGREPSGSTGRLLFLIGVSGLSTLALIVLAALWAGAESDAAALDRQKQLVNARLREQVDQVSKDIDQIAIGYASLATVAPQESETYGESQATRAATSRAAVAASRIATSVFDYDDAFVINESEALIAKDDADHERRYKWMKPLLKPLLAQLRQTADRPGEAGPLIPGTSAISMTRAQGKALSHLKRLQGRPTIVGMVALANEMATKPAVTGEVSAAAYLIVIRFLDGAALDDLSREQGLNGARFARTADADIREVAFQIDATATGDPIGFIIWSPDLPGSRVVGRLVPALSVAGLIIAFLFSFLLMRLRKSLYDLKTSEHQARHLALHDVLTGLPNRAFFKSRFEACIRGEEATGRRSALILIDLDRFKIVNDTHGHGAGDDLIRQASDRMRSVLRPTDVLARLGGDEFALLIEDIGPGDRQATSVMEAILSSVAEPFGLLAGKVQVQIGASLGLAILPDAGSDPDDLMRLADAALYEAKNAGRGRWAISDAASDNGLDEREALKRDLRSMLLGDTANGDLPKAGSVGALELHVQPIHHARDLTLSGAEALVRWRRGVDGLLLPERMMALAEESGVVDALGLWLLREACREAADWSSNLVVAVNIAPAQLRNAGFASDVLAIIKDTGLPPHRLALEVPEEAMERDEPAAKAALLQLRRQGIAIVIDGFGSGLSSLRPLIRSDIDRIKIAPSLVARLSTTANGAATVAAIVNAAGTLGVATTAEGVTTEEQQVFLAAIGCNALQGDSFATPMTAEDFRLYHTALETASDELVPAGSRRAIKSVFGLHRSCDGR